MNLIASINYLKINNLSRPVIIIQEIDSIIRL